MKPRNAIPGSDDILRMTLPNQTVFLSRENDQSPSVVISGYIPGGSILDPMDRSGLSVYLSMALMRGTQHRSFQQIYQELESVGASLGFSAGLHAFSFSGRALTEDLPLVLDILNDILRYPEFPQLQLNQIRDQLLTSLAIRSQDTGDMAGIAFDQALFGSHPYGRDKLGSAESIRAISRTDLLEQHQKIFNPKGLVICIVGGIDSGQAADLVQQRFSDWNTDTNIDPGLSSGLRTPLPLTRVNAHVEIPEKSQLDLVIGSTAPERKSPAYFSALLGNCILGEFGMMGRIGKTVRDDNGLAYYAGSDVNCLPLGGSWEISAGINPRNLQKTTDLIQTEIQRFVTQPVEPDELSDVQSYYVGRMPLRLESNAGIANQLLNIERYDLGLDYLRNYQSMIEAVTREQILETASAYLIPDRLVLGSAGTLEASE